MTTQRKPLTDAQRQAKNERERARRAAKKLETAPVTETTPEVVAEQQLVAAPKPEPTIEPAVAPITSPVVEDDGFAEFTEPTVTPEAPVATPKVKQPQEDPLPTYDCERLQLWAIVYDIPSKSEMNNPTWFFRQRGFRINLSCWVVPEYAIPHNFIRDMRDTFGAKVTMFRFDMSEFENLVKFGVAEINKEIEVQRERTLECIEKAEKRFLDKTDADCDLHDNVEEREAIVERYEQASKSALNRLREIVRDSKRAISAFGLIPEDHLPINAIQNVYKAYQRGVSERAAAFHAATQALRELPMTDAKALADGADGDAVPYQVVADALRDGGADAEADKLQEAMGEFSLVDAAE